MGVNSAELNLDLGSIYAPKTISKILADVSEIGDVSEKSSKLNGFEERIQSERTESLPVTEEFMAFKRDYDKGEGAKTSIDLGDKKDWMSSAQLWSTSKVKCENNYADLKNQFSDGSATEKPFQLCNLRNRGGAFLPFKRQSGLRMEADMGLNLEGKSGSSGSGSSSVTDQMKPPNKPNEPEKKRQRRCWSQELHRVFVDALEQLGGAHKNKGWPYIPQLDAYLDTPTVVSLDRLQLSSCLDALTAMLCLVMSRPSSGVGDAELVSWPELGGSAFLIRPELVIVYIIPLQLSLSSHELDQCLPRVSLVLELGLSIDAEGFAPSNPPVVEIGKQRSDSSSDLADPPSEASIFHKPDAERSDGAILPHLNQVSINFIRIVLAVDTLIRQHELSFNASDLLYVYTMVHPKRESVTHLLKDFNELFQNRDEDTTSSSSSFVSSNSSDNEEEGEEVNQLVLNRRRRGTDLVDTLEAMGEDVIAHSFKEGMSDPSAIPDPPPVLQPILAIITPSEVELSLFEAPLLYKCKGKMLVELWKPDFSIAELGKISLARDNYDKQLAKLRPGIYQEGLFACLKELGIPADHPTWSKVAPEVEQLDPTTPYSSLVLPGFDKEKYLKEPTD
ncbi:Myb family transcription factor EFM like [Actinidia chinensis var. chinensis]|uniref:Myb family transcription factor EFM like n=1 Tax=Actinidia chinensis var. chinensis TaxID=1590841 RepID=A0A2R6PB30_ACTCC|nr:Myb family transcription factor EFM like [Actinidia chinensis var. chinensis]